MTIAVVVPTYNRGDLIGETLAGIQTQTNAASQIIVVDDGSQDNTREIVSKFDVDYIKVENGGPGLARNIGVMAASADWIAFCDSDDLWQPTYLERFVGHLKPTSFYGFANWVDLESDQWTAKDKFAGAPDIFFSRPELPFYDKLVDFTPIWPSATIIKRNFFVDIGGFDPQFSRLPTEDFEFALRCNEHAPAVVMHDALVGIRKHAGNHSRGRIRQNLSDATILAWARDHHCAGARIQPKIDGSIVARRLTALHEAFTAGNFKEVREIAAILPASVINRKDRIKVVLAKSQMIPPSLIRTMFGRCS